MAIDNFLTWEAAAILARLVKDVLSHLITEHIVPRLRVYLDKVGEIVYAVLTSNAAATIGVGILSIGAIAGACYLGFKAYCWYSG